MKEKILFFDFTINYGGALQGTVSLARRLSKNSDVHIIDVYGSSDDYIKAVLEAGLPMHIIYPESKKICIGHQGEYLRRALGISGQLMDFWKIRRRLVRMLAELKPDVVWVNNEKSLVFLLGPLLQAAFPVVFYIRGWGTRDQIGPFLRFLLNKHVKFILAHANATIHQLVALGIPHEKIIYTPNTVDIYIDPLEARNSPPDLPGLERPLKILLPAARPVREKGHLTAVRALRHLVDKGHDAILWFPGKTAAGVGQEFMHELKQLITKYKLDDRVYFIGWRDDFQQVIANADIVILPSHTEGFPRVVIESMFLGVPVCATPVGGVPEAIIDGKTGFIVDIDNDTMLAEKISTIANDPAVRDAIIKKAFDFAFKTFISEAQTTIVKNTFIKAMGG